MLYSISIKIASTLFFSLMVSFYIYAERLNARVELTPKLMFFITYKNILLLKRNGCTPKYIFRVVLPDTSDMFSFEMILSAICSLFFYFFFPSVLFLYLFNIPSDFILAFSLEF